MPLVAGELFLYDDARRHGSARRRTPPSCPWPRRGTTIRSSGIFSVATCIPLLGYDRYRFGLPDVNDQAVGTVHGAAIWSRRYSYDAFVSYARHDGKIDDRVETLVNVLKEKAMRLGARHFDVFIDVKGIPYGEAFKLVILRDIKQSQILVPIVTESYLRSEYCHFEFDEFRKLLHDQQRKIVPVMWNENGIHTCASTDFYRSLFELNMVMFATPHPVRKEINKRPIPEQAEKAVSMLAERISNILHPREKIAR